MTLPPKYQHQRFDSLFLSYYVETFPFLSQLRKYRWIFPRFVQGSCSGLHQILRLQITIMSHLHIYLYINISYHVFLNTVIDLQHAHVVHRHPVQALLYRVLPEKLNNDNA